MLYKQGWRRLGLNNGYGGKLPHKSSIFTVIKVFSLQMSINNNGPPTIIVNNFQGSGHKVVLLLLSMISKILWIWIILTWFLCTSIILIGTVMLCNCVPLFSKIQYGIKIKFQTTSLVFIQWDYFPRPSCTTVTLYVIRCVPVLILSWRQIFITERKFQNGIRNQKWVSFWGSHMNIICWLKTFKISIPIITHCSFMWSLVEFSQFI